MQIPELMLGYYLARWGPLASYSLGNSDVEDYCLDDLLALADDECRALWRRLALGYTTPHGHPLLRAEIAALYTGAEPEEILTCAGADEAIFVLFNALLGPGDHAVITWPGYQSLSTVAQATGAEVTLLPLRAEAGWALDLVALRRVLRPTTRLIVVNFPHNPTGALPDRATFVDLVALADEAGVTLFCDEVYRLLEYDAADRLPAAVDCSPRAVSLGVMSKAFGLAGLRVGWLATHDANLLRRAAAFKAYTSACNSAPSEILALIALRAKDRVLARNSAIIGDNLARLDHFVAGWADVFDWVRPRGGSVAFPRLTAPLPIDQFATELVEQQGVMLLPGSIFGHPGNHFRIGFGRADLSTALERLGQFTAVRLGHTGPAA